MNDQALQQKAAAIALQAGLPTGWKVVIVGMRELGSDMGRCCYISKTIRIRRLRINETWSFYRSTVLHEVAHALTSGHGHDRVWDAKFTELLHTFNPNPVFRSMDVAVSTK